MECGEDASSVAFSFLRYSSGTHERGAGASPQQLTVLGVTDAMGVVWQGLEDNVVRRTMRREWYGGEGEIQRQLTFPPERWDSFSSWWSP
jgi:hypothetical protein